MLDQLPVLINPLSFCDRGKRLVGAIKISQLARLSDSLLDDSGAISIDFSFDKEERLPTLQGNIKTVLILQCQTCLKQVEWPIDKDFKLGLVTSLEQADRLTSDCEPLLLKDEKILLTDLVEDELLLALPDFPRHNNVCMPEEKDRAVAKSNDAEQLNSNNPFSVLADLKNTGD